MSQLLEYCRALTRAEIDSSTHWLMSEAVFWGHGAVSAAPRVLRSGMSFCRISAQGKDHLGNPCGKLIVTLVAGTPSEKPPAPDSNRGSLWRSFSAREVYRFSEETGDRNAVHLAKRPVVQGLLLFDTLHTHMGTDCAGTKMRFYAPVYAGDWIYVDREPGRCAGYCNERMCFTVETATRRRT